MKLQFKKLWIVSATLISYCCLYAQDDVELPETNLMINEIMQSNIDCLMDDLNEFPDSWVELYNPGEEEINLANYAISDELIEDNLWYLPELSIQPKGYVLLYCDKVGDGLHANFRLDSGKGGNIYLWKNNEVVDKIENWKKQPSPNIAYGRKIDGDDEFGYLSIPTPGAANCGVIYPEVARSPVFSIAGGIMSEPLDLELSLPKKTPEDSYIVYTLDGTEPTSESTRYESTIHIDTSTVVRALVISEGYLTPRSSTQSYIFDDSHMPIVSLVTNSKYFFDEELGIYTLNVTNLNKVNVRRPSNIEYYEPDSDESINQLIELKVKGNASRVHPLKSLALYANKRFGEKNFKHEFFPDQAPGIEKWKSLEMKNGGNDFYDIYCRDEWVQYSMGMHADLDWQPHNYVQVYLNGEWLGLMSLRPRADEDNIYSFYDGLEDVDVIETWWEVKEGSFDEFEDFRNFFNEEGHTITEYEERLDLNEFANYLVMETFFSNNDWPHNNVVLWRPRIETGKWRFIAKDLDCCVGRYSFNSFDKPILYEITDPSYNGPAANFSHFTKLIESILKVPEFQDMMIDRYCVYLGSFLSEKVIVDNLTKIQSIINPSVIKMGEKYTGVDNNILERRTGYAHDWVSKRTTFFMDHVKDFFKLGSIVDITVEESPQAEDNLYLNGIKLESNSFQGKWYAGRTLELDCDLFSDSLKGWKIEIIPNKENDEENDEEKDEEIIPEEPSASSSDSFALVDIDDEEGPVDPIDPTDPVDPISPVDPVDTIDPIDPVEPVDPEDPNNPEESIVEFHEVSEDSNKLSFVVPDCASLKITPVFHINTHVSEPIAGSVKDEGKEYYDITGKRLQSLPDKGFVIIRSDNMKSKKILKY